jgi:hypothetical protein
MKGPSQETEGMECMLGLQELDLLKRCHRIAEASGMII